MDNAAICRDGCRLDHFVLRAELVVCSNRDLANRIHVVIDLLRPRRDKFILQYGLLDLIRRINLSGLGNHDWLLHRNLVSRNHCVLLEWDWLDLRLRSNLLACVKCVPLVTGFTFRCR